MTEHTPGPWEAVAVTPYAQKTNRRWLINPDVAVCKTDANARLIAAAPDLLEACKVLIAVAGQCEYCQGSGRDTFDTEDACRECGGMGENCDAGPYLPDLRDAIAKAEEKETPCASK